MSSSPYDSLRLLREDDAEEVAALFVDTFGSSRLLDAAEIRSWLGNRQLQREWLRVLEVDGRVVGYGDIWPSAEALDLDTAAPGYWDVFFDWAEDEARRRSLGRVRIQVPYGHPLAEIVAERGYVPWRFSYTMEIELRERPVARPPEAVELLAYRESDAEVLCATLNEAFVADPFWHTLGGENFADIYFGARGFDPTLWLLAWDGAELAGCSLSYPVHGTDTELGWVATLGVRPRWRRRGLGEALLLSSFGLLFDRGLRRVGLGVDSQNVTGALRLYERVGMRKVRQSDNWALHL